MRTKINKRIGPVPITLVAVFALAAFLSAGLLLTTGSVQPAEAQSADCTVMLRGATAATADNPATLGTSDMPQDDSECYGTAGRAATVAIPGDSDGMAKQTVYVYAKGGTITGGANVRLYAPDAMPGMANAVPPVPAPPTTGYSHIELEIDPFTAAGTTGAGVAIPAQLAYENIAVAATSGGDEVTLYIYYSAITPFETDWNHDGDADSAGVPNKLNAAPDDNETDGIAIVTINYVRGVDTDESEIASDVVPSGTTEAMLTVTVMDENEKPIPGFINLTVAGGNSVLFEASNLKTLRAKLAAGVARPVVQGLPSTGAFRIAITGEIGGVTLEDNIIREGPPDSVTVAVYEPCVGKACEADDDLTVKPGDTFFVKATAKDMADNDVTTDAGFAFVGNDDDSKDALEFGGVEDWWNGLSCPQMNDAVSPTMLVTGTLGEPQVGSDNPDAATPSPYCEMYAVIAERPNNNDDDDGVNEALAVEVIDRAFDALRAKGWTVAIVDDEADAGMYSVKATTTNGVSATVTITVSDAASMMMVSCDPEVIDTMSGLTDCTIQVTDSAGNTPSNLGAKMVNNQPAPDTARVAVRSRDVTLIGPNAANEVTLDSSGMGSFTILLREDAPVDSTITINVSSTIGGVLLQASTTVTYGEADGETPEIMPEGEMMGEATNVIASSFPDSGTVGATWTPAEGADQHIVVLFSLPDYTRVDLVTLGADAAMHTFSDVPAGEYEVLVAAFTEEGGFQYGDDTADDVTVE
jgi:hypothetical protein